MGVTRYWAFSKESMQKMIDAGLIVQTKEGGVPQRKRYIDESEGVPLQDIWVDIAAVQGGALENANYATNHQIIGIFFGAILILTIGMNYHFLMNRYPDSGGIFTYTKKIFGYDHGFLSAWFLVLTYIVIIWANATAMILIFRRLFGNMFQVGLHYQVAGYDVYFGEVLLALTALFVFAWLSIRGVSVTGKFQTMLVMLLVGGIAVVSIEAFLHPQAHFSNFSPGFPPTADSHLVAILSILAISPWAFVGFDTIPQAAEEFNFSVKIFL